jgi:hypothetical protein
LRSPLERRNSKNVGMEKNVELKLYVSCNPIRI